ncbi:MAG: hypothetical protein ACYDAD_10170 [Acidimicrobiales bacterium]
MLPGVAGQVAGHLVGFGIEEVLHGLTGWVAQGAGWLLGQLATLIDATTSTDLDSAWFRRHLELMVQIAGVVVLPLLFASVLGAIVRQDASGLARTFLVRLPLALLGTVVVVQMVVIGLRLTDSLSQTVSGGASGAASQAITGLAATINQITGAPQGAGFALFLVGGATAIGAFLLWLELVLRSTAIYVSVLFLPLGLVGLVWPSTSHWCRRLLETLAGLVLAKFVIVAVLSLAAGALAAGPHAGLAAVVSGAAMVALAVFAPYALFRLIPVAEVAAATHLEGLSRRPFRSAREAATMGAGMAAGSDEAFSLPIGDRERAAPGAGLIPLSAPTPLAPPTGGRWNQPMPDEADHSTGGGGDEPVR